MTDARAGVLRWGPVMASNLRSGSRWVRRGLALGTALTLSTFGARAVLAGDGWSEVVEGETSIREIVYPVDGRVWFQDSWLAPRSGGRRHLGVDMMGDKLTPLLAARAGCITYLNWGDPGESNMLTLTDSQGWQYRYIHLNNDSPGTDDGANDYDLAFAVQPGECVEAGQTVGFLGDSGNAEETPPHLHFEIRRPDGYWINPFPSVEAAADREACQGENVNPPAEPDPGSSEGYWLLDSSGRVHAFDAPHFGDLRTEGIETPAASMAATPTGEGYWIVDLLGEVHSFGDAADLGDMRDHELNAPILGIESHPTGEGYWLVAGDGGIFAFGTAAFLGSLGDRTLNAPVIGVTATADGEGYWLVAGDGGVFAFGTATFFGSAGSLDLVAPVIDMAVLPEGDGYWLYAADGGVFSYGDAPFLGSAPGTGRCDLSPAVALGVNATGEGYWIAMAEGNVLTLGTAFHHGDRPELHLQGSAESPDPAEHLHATIIDMAARPHPVTPPEMPDEQTGSVGTDGQT